MSLTLFRSDLPPTNCFAKLSALETFRVVEALLALITSERPEEDQPKAKGGPAEALYWASLTCRALHRRSGKAAARASATWHSVGRVLAQRAGSSWPNPRVMGELNDVADDVVWALRKPDEPKGEGSTPPPEA